MINVHGIANKLIRTAHPNESVTLYQSSGQTNTQGRITAAYGDPIAVEAQIQTLSTDDLAQAESVNTTKPTRKAYLYAPADMPIPRAQWRPLARSGDFILRADSTWWLVTSLLEDFSAAGWVSVAITLQVDGPEGVTIDE